jgi:hypothetical protein
VTRINPPFVCSLGGAVLRTTSNHDSWIEVSYFFYNRKSHSQPKARMKGRSLSRVSSSSCRRVTKPNVIGKILTTGNVSFASSATHDSSPPLPRSCLFSHFLAPHLQMERSLGLPLVLV